MTPTAEPVLVYTTWPDAETADNAARELVTRRLAACANRLGEITSTYEWQGRIEHGTEVAMLIKSTATRFAAVSAALAELHPEDVPAILALPGRAAPPPVAAWVAAQPAPPSPDGGHHG